MNSTDSLILDNADAEPTASDALKKLKTAYRHWCDHLQRNGHRKMPHTSDQTKHLAHCFSRFGVEQDAVPDRVKKLVLAVDRSKSLLDSALNWETATVGNKANQTDADRGAQWRLVMAWCGIEQLIDTIMKDRRYSSIEKFLMSFDGNSIPPVDPPRETAKLRKWREEPDLDILELLSPNKVGRELIQRWLIHGESLKTRTEVLVLAQNFRHATAHGALSASKIRQWGMRDAFDRLIVEIGLVGAAAMEQLVYASGDAEIAGKNRSDDGKIKALNLAQPHAEAVMRGLKNVEIRTQATTVRGRVYIYASHTRLDAEEEKMLMQVYRIIDVTCDALSHGAILGTIELTDCTRSEDRYEWHLRNPKRRKKPIAPDNTPRATWFIPF